MNISHEGVCIFMFGVLLSLKTEQVTDYKLKYDD